MDGDNPDSPTGRGLRRLTARVPVPRRKPSSPPAGPARSSAPVADSPDPKGPPASPAGSTSASGRRADPVLRWKDPSQAPRGAFAACAVPNAQLQLATIPERGDPWDAVSSLSLSYDGYAYWDDVTELATRSIRSWTRDRAVPGTIDEIRACLFYEQRRWHHFGEDPSGRGARYIGALLDALRALVAARPPAVSEAAPAPALVVRAAPSSICSFLDDDPGYLAWASAHANGFVVNADRTLSPNSLMLHRATCSCIGGPATNGRTRTGNYRKVCGPDAEALRAWCRSDIGIDPPACRHCRPRPPAPAHSSPLTSM
jgi:hypothetical protein